MRGSQQRATYRSREGRDRGKLRSQPGVHILQGVVDLLYSEEDIQHQGLLLTATQVILQGLPEHLRVVFQQSSHCLQLGLPPFDAPGSSRAEGGPEVSNELVEHWKGGGWQ